MAALSARTCIGFVVQADLAQLSGIVRVLKVACVAIHPVCGGIWPKVYPWNLIRRIRQNPRFQNQINTAKQARLHPTEEWQSGRMHWS
jgi:hypothetical protein